LRGARVAQLEIDESKISIGAPFQSSCEARGLRNKGTAIGGKTTEWFQSSCEARGLRNRRRRDHHRSRARRFNPLARRAGCATSYKMWNADFTEKVSILLRGARVAQPEIARLMSKHAKCVSILLRGARVAQRKDKTDYSPGLRRVSILLRGARVAQQH